MPPLDLLGGVSGLREAEGRTHRRAESSASDSDDRLSGLDNRQKRIVLGRSMSAAERELARHSTITKAAETARIDVKTEKKPYS